MTSSEKLKDPRWQKKRLQIMERDGWKCLGCGDDKMTLAVHHLVYSGEPWEAPDQYLETLCEWCHDIREQFNRAMDGRSTIPTSVVIELYWFNDFLKRLPEKAPKLPKFAEHFGLWIKFNEPDYEEMAKFVERPLQKAKTT